MNDTNLLSSQDPALKSTRVLVDLELLAFIARYAKGQIAWNLTAFFSVHPQVTMDISRISVILRRPADVIRPVLGDLVLRGFLVTQRYDGTLMYKITSDDRVLSTAARFGEYISVSCQAARDYKVGGVRASWPNS